MQADVRLAKEELKGLQKNRPSKVNRTEVHFLVTK